MLTLPDHPVRADAPDAERPRPERAAGIVDTVQGDPELAAMLDIIRSLLAVDSVALRLVTAHDQLGPVLARAGRPIHIGGAVTLPHAAAAPIGRIGGVWLPGDPGPAIHASILQPRARDRIAMICLPRRGDMTDRRQFERHMRWYLPLIERTIAQWAQAHVERLRRRQEHAVFDTFGFGLLTVDIECRIHMSNAAADAILEAPGVLSRKDGHLAILHVEDAMRFQVSLRHVLGSAEAPAKPPGKPIVVTISRRGGLPLLLALRALPTLGTEPKLAVIEITDPHAVRELPLESLSRHFDLTLSERRLVEQLVRGKTLHEAAAAMRLKEQTARTYLKQIFQKTGLRRQVELINMVLAGTMPGLCAA